MSSFVTTAFSDGNDISLQVNREEWVRTMTIGSSWTHLRIGILYQITGTADIAASNGFAMGVCSGTAHPFADPVTTTNFIGIYANNGLHFVSNAPNNWWQFTNSMLFGATKVGTTLTTSATNFADSVGMFATVVGGTNRRGILYLDITKGSPNYTLGITLPINGGSATSTDFTINTLLRGMNETFGSILNTEYPGFFNNGNTPDSTMAASEGPGGFDTVNIYSNLLNNPMEIQEVAVQKIS